MKDLQPFLYNVIKDELKRVEDAHVAPVFASKRVIMNAVQKEVDSALQALKEDGLITESMNVNHIPLYRLTERK